MTRKKRMQELLLRKPYETALLGIIYAITYGVSEKMKNTVWLAWAVPLVAIVCLLLILLLFYLQQRVADRIEVLDGEAAR